jgi:hypothetical protein
MPSHKKVEELRALAQAGLPGLPCCRLAGPPGTAGGGKTVYFVRHGEAIHNVAAKNKTGEGNPYLDPALTDAPLTPLGQEQARALAPASSALQLDVVLTSPLVRAVETACLGFPAQLEAGVPFLAVELCREQIGQNLCDARRPKAIAAAAFPRVDLSGVAEEDELFTPARESLSALATRAGASAGGVPAAQFDDSAPCTRLVPPRARKLAVASAAPPPAAPEYRTSRCSTPTGTFLELLRQRPEQTLAVVTHSSFLAALTNAALDARAAP